MAETNKTDVHALMKFGKKVHIEKLYEEGEVYMRPMADFWKEDEDEYRKDKKEGVSYIQQGEKTELFKMGSNNKIATFYKGDKESHSIRFNFWQKEDEGNLYCMTSVTENELNTTPMVDEKNKEMGSHFLLIYDPLVFVQRLDAELNNLGYSLSNRLVAYYDPKKFNGRVGPFKKERKYNFQNEFRYFVQNESREPLKFHVGPLKDIAQMFTANDLERVSLKLGP